MSVRSTRSMEYAAIRDACDTQFDPVDRDGREVPRPSQSADLGATALTPLGRTR